MEEKRIKGKISIVDGDGACFFNAVSKVLHGRYDKEIS